MSPRYASKLLAILESDLGFIVQHKPKSKLKGGRPPKMYKPASPFPDAPKGPEVKCT